MTGRPSEENASRRLTIGSQVDTLIHHSVSVVIPVRNRAQDLSIVLESLSKQTLEHQCIVVDQGSTDGTREVCRGFGAAVIQGRSPTVGGLRNEGIHASNSQIIALIDSDHQVPSDWLATGLRALEENPQAGIVGAPCFAPQNAGLVAKAWEAHRRRACQRVHRTQWLGAGNMFFRKADFLNAGGFDPGLQATEDVDFCHRIRAMGLEVILDPRIRNIHLGEPDSLSKFFRKQVWRGAGGWTAWRKHGCPWTELKSLLFPLWVVGGAFATAMALFGWFQGWGWRENYPNPFIQSILIAALWVLPMLIQAISVAISTSNRQVIVPLMLLYGAFGAARFCSLPFAIGSLLGTPARKTTNKDANA